MPPASGRASWFDGLDRTGRLQVERITPSAIQLSTTHDRLRMVGLDATTTWQGFGLRTEVAHFMPQTEGALVGNRGSDQTFGVLGLDRNLPNDWYVNVQAIVRQTWHHTAPRDIANPLDRTLSLMNDIRTNQTEATRYGGSIYLKKNWNNETVQTDLFALYYPDSGDLMFRPRIDYKVNDDLRLSLGMERFLGGDETPLGSLRKNSLVFTEVRHGF